MKLDFYKYHGHGNDFILLDNLDGSIKMSQEQVVQLCHRHFGIGSDGIILLEKHSDANYYMLFYNPDGSQSFCGNGSRCAVHFAKSLGLIKDKAYFEAIDGFHEGWIKDDLTSIHMLDVKNIEKGNGYYYLNTGSPHFVKLVDSLDGLDVVDEGRKIRYNERFKEKGTNVNFLEIEGSRVSSRVYERGVENETFSSGTGTTATAISAYLEKNSLGKSIDVNTRGGVLNVRFETSDNESFSDIWLTGKVHHPFKGQIKL